MSKSIKFRNDIYLDSRSVIYINDLRKIRLYDLISHPIYFYNTKSVTIEATIKVGSVILLWVATSGGGSGYKPSLALLHVDDVNNFLYTSFGGNMISNVTYSSEKVTFVPNNAYGRYGYIVLR